MLPVFETQMILGQRGQREWRGAGELDAFEGVKGGNLRFIRLLFFPNDVFALQPPY